VIDWLTIRLLGTESVEVRSGFVISLDRDGKIEWQSPKREQVRGSHDATVSIRKAHDGNLEVSGNPAKFLQGHNVWGTSDLRVASDFAHAVTQAAGITLDQVARQAVDDLAMICTRIDTTESWTFDTQPRALAAVRGIADFGHFKHRGRGSLLAEGTAYFAQKSRRLSGKAYAKGLELQKHPIPRTLAGAERITEIAAGLVRVEFTARSMWLKDRELDVLSRWSRLGVTPSTLHAELMSQLNLSDATMRDAATVEGLPPRLNATYQLWLDGHDLRQMFPARTFYRYRAQLLPHGVDIATKRPREASNVVPLRVVLTGKPFEVPDWARGTDLYYEPKARAA